MGHQLAGDAIKVLISWDNVYVSWGCNLSLCLQIWVSNHENYNCVCICCCEDLMEFFFAGMQNIFTAAVFFIFFNTHLNVFKGVNLVFTLREMGKLLNNYRYCTCRYLFTDAQFLFGLVYGLFYFFDTIPRYLWKECNFIIRLINENDLPAAFFTCHINTNCIELGKVYVGICMQPFTPGFNFFCLAPVSLSVSHSCTVLCVTDE